MTVPANRKDVCTVNATGHPLLVKAQESLRCARRAKDEGWFNSAGSRLYYAFFQTCKQLFVSKKINYRVGRESHRAGYSADIPHGEIVNFFYGRKDTETAKLAGHLYGIRKRADYFEVPVGQNELQKEWENAEQGIQNLVGEILNGTE